ncbi:MAG TPA: tetraacyldisaccharide 4'-kinase [Elusimicrobia bacterium]|nr:tetraacyldisaccharide 4'-kinase [Elusimicrobiota bacterium]
MPEKTLAERRARLKESALGRLFLRALSLLYGFGVALRNAGYSLRLLSSKRLPVRTVCIGNLTVGGTGKTTAVLMAAQALCERQIKTAILSRGYRRGKETGEVLALLDSSDPAWDEVGDEPWMMHRLLKGRDVPILVAADRYKAGLAAVKYYAPQVVLLDDGFQHRRLRRDADIVLVSAVDPFGGGSLLPFGNLREPLSALGRATLAVITHADRADAARLELIRAALSRACPGLAIAEAVHRPDCVLDLKSDARHAVSCLKGRSLTCLSGLGDPQSFEESLRRAGARLGQVWRFPDHHPYTLQDLRSIENLRGQDPIVTTLKDLPRLPAQWREVLSGEVLALAIKMEITSGLKDWETALFGDHVRHRPA